MGEILSSWDLGIARICELYRGVINVKKIHPCGTGLKAKNTSRCVIFLAWGCGKTWQKPEVLCTSAASPVQ